MVELFLSRGTGVTSDRFLAYEALRVSRPLSSRVSPDCLKDVHDPSGVRILEDAIKPTRVEVSVRRLVESRRLNHAVLTEIIDD